MDDNHLVGYRDHLLNEHKKGKASQINKHLRTAIYYLMWLEKEKGAEFVTKGRTKTIAISTDERYTPSQIVVYSDNFRNKHGKASNNLYHESFLEPSIPRLRKPILDDALDKLWSAIPEVCGSFARQLRNEITLSLLEFLGARKSEIFNITVDDALDGIKTGEIIVFTKKREPGHSRKLPLNGTIASKLKHYINTVRSPLVKKAIEDGRVIKDHKRLIISIHGTPWHQRSLNHEIKILAESAGIRSSMSPHLFRHTHFTRLTERLRDLDEHKVRLILKARGGWKSEKSAATYQHADALRDKQTEKVLKKAQAEGNAKVLKRTVINRLEEIINSPNKDTKTELEELKKWIEN